MKVDTSHDIPYLAGYSKDGSTIYIDRDVPRTFLQGKRRGDVHKYLVIHEQREKALMDSKGYNYPLAHQEALVAERNAVEADGFDWAAYNGFMETWIKKVGDKRLRDVPEDLDLKPYHDSRDIETMKHIESAAAKRLESAAAVKTDKMGREFIKFKCPGQNYEEEPSKYEKRLDKVLDKNSVPFTGVKISKIFRKPNGDYSLYEPVYFEGKDGEMFGWIGTDTENPKGFGLKLLKIPKNEVHKIPHNRIRKVTASLVTAAGAWPKDFFTALCKASKQPTDDEGAFTERKATVQIRGYYDASAVDQGTVTIRWVPIIKTHRNLIKHDVAFQVFHPTKRDKSFDDQDKVVEHTHLIHGFLIKAAKPLKIKVAKTSKEFLALAKLNKPAVYVYPHPKHGFEIALSDAADKLAWQK